MGAVRKMRKCHMTSCPVPVGEGERVSTRLVFFPVLPGLIPFPHKKGRKRITVSFGLQFRCFAASRKKGFQGLRFTKAFS
jgi:hypothetical protein